MNMKNKHYDDDGQLQASASTIRVEVTLTYAGKTCIVKAVPPALRDGILTISERARREACKKLECDHDDPNPGIASSANVQVLDANGWQTFRFYARA